jgi:hypothetical protein
MSRSTFTKLFPYVFGLLASAGLAGSARADDAAEKPQYVGAESCAKLCHKTEKQGSQLSIWEESSHAKAFQVLASPKALEVGKAKGIDNPQQSNACLKCHVTGHGVSDDLKDAKFSHEEGVGCEACHGAGSLYKKRSVMKDRDAAVAAGLVIPDEKTCLKCHNKESPTFKPFDYKERYAKIAHAKPAEE